VSTKAFADGKSKMNIYLMYRKKLGVGVANGDDGHKFTECLAELEARAVNGVMIVWKFPSGPFMRKADDPDHQNYNP
jgi:hypothetical protein